MESNNSDDDDELRIMTMMEKEDDMLNGVRDNILWFHYTEKKQWMQNKIYIYIYTPTVYFSWSKNYLLKIYNTHNEMLDITLKLEDSVGYNVLVTNDF